MHAHINLFAFLLLISGILSGIASFTAWQRSVPGSFALSLLMFFMMIWAGSYALIWLPIFTSIKLFSPYITYIGVVTVPTAFLFFALTFVNYMQYFKRWMYVVLLTVPVVTMILVWTNNYHHLILKSVEVVNEGNTSWVQLNHGPWYFFNMGYSYLVIVAGLAVLIHGILRSSPLLIEQNRLILLAALIPWGVNVYSEFFIPDSIFDLTPLTFGLSGILFTYSVIRNGFMDLIPLARSRIVESMSDGVLVLDTQNRIVDINPAMEGFLNQKPAYFLGKHVSEALTHWTDLDESLSNGQETRTEMRIANAPSRYLDLRVTLLHDHNQRLNGKLLVFRDVTDRKQVEKRLRSANDQLQSQLIEIGTLQSKLRSQAIRDPLTNLFNRRYLDETFDREIQRAASEGYTICVIMLDIDHFKKINDTYGHEAGDMILKALAETLSAHNRRGDFVCRFGGEEFVVILPNIAIETALKRAKEMREALNSLKVEYGKFSLSITISTGIASYPTNGKDRESVLRSADRAMYAAKQAGRDHILTYDMLESQQKGTSD